MVLPRNRRLGRHSCSSKAGLLNREVTICQATGSRWNFSRLAESPKVLGTYEYGHFSKRSSGTAGVS